MSNGITIINSNFFYLKNIEFKNCRGSKGGSILIRNSKGIIDSLIFDSSDAYFGNSIYIENSTINIKDSSFLNSNGSDIYIINSTLTTSQVLSSIPTPSLVCRDSILHSNEGSVSPGSVICDGCSTDPLLCKTNLYNETSPVYFSGMLFIYNSSNSNRNFKFPVSQFDSNFLQYLPKNQNGSLEGYLLLNEPKSLVFNIIASNIQFSMKIKSRTILNSMVNSDQLEISSEPIYFEENVHHKIYISIVSTSSNSKFEILPFSTGDKFFYSNNLDSNPSNVVCDTVDMNNNFEKCYKELSKSCPTRTTSKGHLPAGFNFEDDTLGDLISNQFLWSLPGSQHLTFGVNIITGENGNKPLFQFDYCGNTDTIIEDTYREAVFKVPPQLNIKLFPQCTFTTSSTFYNSSSEFQSSISKDTSVEGSLEGGFDDVSVSAAFSGEKSVSQSQSVSTTSSTTIIVTDIDCFSSYVELDDSNIMFSRAFLKDLSEIKEESDMLKIIEHYGTFYYKSTYLGGRLRQISTTSTSSTSVEDQSSLSESASASLSASVGSHGSVSANANYAGSQESSSSSEQSNSMSSSNVVAYGGAPSDIQSNFVDWSSSIDLFPVPLDYKLLSIRDILNENWNITIGSTTVNIKELWTQMEEIFYDIHGKSYKIDNQDDGSNYHYSIFLMAPLIGTNIDHSITFYYNETSGSGIIYKPLPYLHITPDGQEHEMNFDADYPFVCNVSTTYDESFYSSEQLNQIYNAYPGLPKKCPSSGQIRISPFRFDFSSQYDIMNLPSLSIYQDFPTTNIYFVQWDSGKSFIIGGSFNSTYLKTASVGTSYLLMGYELELSSRLDYYTEQNFADSTPRKWPPRPDYPNFLDAISMSFGFAKLLQDQGDHIPVDYAYFYNDQGPQTYAYYQYLEVLVPYVSTPNSLYIYARNYFGPRIRVNWALVFTPSQTNNFIFDVLSYNINSDSSSDFDIISQPYPLKNITSNGPSYQYHTHNYNKPLRYSFNNIDDQFNTNAPNPKVQFLKL